MPSVTFANTIGGGSGSGVYTSRESIVVNNQWIQQSAPTPPPSVAPPVIPVTPTFDPKIEANALYGKPMVLSALGFARIGAAPAPIVGPYLNAGKVDFIVSFGVPADPAGTRLIYAIYLDNELAWSSVTGGTLPADGTFTSEAFDFVFKPGTLTQTVCSLETIKFPGDECAYRPQMLLEIRNLTYARFMAITGKPVPYVACDVGDTTDGADPQDGITIGEGYERIAYSPWVGWDSTKLEEVGTADVTGGYLLRDNFNIIQLGQSLTNVYRNLVLSTSDKVRLIDRGSNVTPDIVFGRDTIIGGEGGITITRTSPSAQPREDELFTVDPDQDYTVVPSQSKRARNPVVVSASVGKQSSTLPVILDASTRQALVTYAQYHSENARKKVAFRTTMFGCETEPGDLFALDLDTDGLDNEVFKATEVTVNGDWTVDIQGEAILRCSIYGTDFDPFLGYVVLLLGFPGADGSTSIIDESPAVHGSATVIGNAQVDTAVSKFGGSSLLSDGTTDGLSFPDSVDWTLSSANSDQFTVEAFGVLTTDTPVGKVIVCQFGGGSPNMAWLLWINNSGELEFIGSTNGSALNWSASPASSGIGWSIGVWYHFVADKDATGKVRVYRDGVMLGSATPSDSSLFTSAAPLTVACDSAAGGRSWPGHLDEVRITKGIARYASDAGFTVPTAEFPRV